jgi:hypothetical protein
LIDQRNPLVIAGGGTGETERGVEFIDIAERFDAQGGLRDALAKQQVGVAGIAPAGDDAHGEKFMPEKNQCPSAFIRDSSVASMKLAKLGDGPEIFHTIQGEGVSVGAPAVFIRASRCNLHCVWCDTDHTWNFEGTPWPHEKDALPGYAKHRKAEVTCEIEPLEAAERVLAFACPRTVITGGEPLLQETAFLEMIGHIRERQPEHQFEVETNGTRIPSPAFHEAPTQGCLNRCDSMRRPCDFSRTRKRRGSSSWWPRRRIWRKSRHF